MDTTRITDRAVLPKAGIWRQLCHGLCVAALVFMAACGGGGGGDGGSSTEPPPPATVGADGGTVTAEGVKVIVPPGAMTSEATIRVAKDSTGSPVLPNWVEAAGDMLAITPHGSAFADDVIVRLPVPTITLNENQRLLIAKAQPGGEWEVLGDTVTRDGVLEAKVRSFSFFTAVIVTDRPPPRTGAFGQSFGISSMTLECNGTACASPEVIRPLTVAATIAHNGVPTPENCVSPKLELQSTDLLSASPWQLLATWVPTGGQPAVRQTFALPLSANVIKARGIFLRVQLRCTDAGTNASSSLVLRTERIDIGGYPRILDAGGVDVAVVQFPNALRLAVGETLSLSVVLHGGGVNSDINGNFTAPDFSIPRLYPNATIYLERLSRGELGWQPVTSRSQSDANPSPLGGPAWANWGFDIPVGTVTSADDGASFRIRGCYEGWGPSGFGQLVPRGTICTTGPIATLTVFQHTEVPRFTQQPRSVLVTAGQTASFSVVPAGLPAPTLKWQSRPANATGDWQDVTAGIGASTANYTTPVLSAADNGMQYRALATNSVDSVPSDVVTVSLGSATEPARIANQPTSLTVVEGSEALFAVTARGTEAISYAWFKNGSPVTGNGPQLRIGIAKPADAGTYWAIATNSAGSDTSTQVTLTVQAAGMPALVAPGIVTQPAAGEVPLGQAVTLAAGVTGSGTLSYQWRKGGSDIPNATTPVLSLPSFGAADDGSYTVVVSNAAGSATSTAATLSGTLTDFGVAQAPVILVQPGSVVVPAGLQATLAVSARGSGSLTYQWWFNGSAVNGQTRAAYQIDAATALDAGTYEVRVSNSTGTVTSATATVTVAGAAAIAAQPTAQAAVEGATARFGVTATGDGVRYQWLRNNVAIVGAQAATYETPPLSLAGSGAVYSVVVYNNAGVIISQGAALTVTPAIPPDPPGMALLAGDIVAGGGSGAVDGIGRNARLDTPEGLVADGAGNVYVAESNSNKIARIAPNGQVTTILALPFDAYSQPNALALAPDGSLLAAASSCGLHRITAPAGPSPSATRLPLEGNCPGSSVRGVAVDASGVIHLPITDANSIGRIGATPVAGIYPVELWAGALNRFVPPGSSDGRGIAASFNAPRGAVFGPTGDLFVADSGNRTIRRITPQGDVVTVAGTAGAIGRVDGIGANARFVNPTDLSFDPAGNLLVLDRGDPAQSPGVGAHSFVRRITPDGAVVTLFDVSAEALPLINPPDINGPAFVNTVRGIAALSVTRIALSVGNAVLVRTLAP